MDYVSLNVTNQTLPHQYLSINIMQCVLMYFIYAFADLRKTTVRCQPDPTVLHINCRLTVNKQDMISQKFPCTLQTYDG